jgi:hypothetical protein
MVQLIRLILVLSLVSMAAVGHAATPCDGIDQGFSSQEEEAWAPVIIKQLNVILPKMNDTEHVSSIDVLKVFRSGGWTIIYVGDFVTDELYLFYKGDPLSGSYITMDAGAVPLDEEHDIEMGITKAAHGIPQNLARCYAWYFVEGR